MGNGTFKLGTGRTQGMGAGRGAVSYGRLFPIALRYAVNGDGPEIGTVAATRRGDVVCVWSKAVVEGLLKACKGGLGVANGDGAAQAAVVAWCEDVLNSDHYRDAE